MIDTGIDAPAFSLQDQNGDMVSLEDLRGKWVALWWYAKASTRG